MHMGSERRLSTLGATSGAIIQMLQRKEKGAVLGRWAVEYRAGLWPVISTVAIAHVLGVTRHTIDSNENIQKVAGRLTSGRESIHP